MSIIDMEAQVFKAPAHPVRLAIVHKLKNGSKCVCELFDENGFSQPNGSVYG